MFEEFYEMYELQEQEVVALINRCIGGRYNSKGDFWEMAVLTLGMVFCDTGKVSNKEERLEWPVIDEERGSNKDWERFHNEQICRLKIRRIKEEWVQNLVTRPWCISEVVKAHEDCPELQAILDEYHKPVVIQDKVLGKLELANNWLSQDEENPRVSETAPITEEEFSWRISMTSLTVTSDGSFTAYFDCDELFTDHAVTVYGSLKKGVKDACIEG